MAFRNNFVWAFIGKSGAGKTVTAKQVAKDWKSARFRMRRRGEGGKIFAFDPHDAFYGIADIKIDAKDEDWASVIIMEVCKSCGKRKKTSVCSKCGSTKFYFPYANSLIILDDYRTLLKSNQMPPDFLDLLALRRRLNLDIIYMVHNPKLILERLSYFSTHFSVFRTEANADDFADKIQKFLTCQRASILVNAYVRLFDEKGYNALYPNFPYVFVQNDSDQLFPMNMDEEIIKELQLA